MDAVRVGVVIWAAVLGYYLLYHGVQRLASVGGSTGTAPGAGGERAFLAMQPMVAA